MAKYIDREALIEWLKRIPLTDLSDGRGLCRVIMEDNFKKAIQKMPEGIIVDVTPVRHGRWVSVPHKLARVCSVCNRDEPYKFADIDADVYDYCPYCGAKMDGGDNSATD